MADDLQECGDSEEREGGSEKRGEVDVSGVGFSVRMIFSSKCSMAMLEMSLNSVRISWARGSVLLF